MKSCWIYSQLRIKSTVCSDVVAMLLRRHEGSRQVVNKLLATVCSNHCFKKPVLSCGQSFIRGLTDGNFLLFMIHSIFLKPISSWCHAGDDRSISETDDGGAAETNLRFLHFIHQVYHLLVNLKLNKCIYSLSAGSAKYLPSGKQSTL